MNFVNVAESVKNLNTQIESLNDQLKKVSASITSKAIQNAPVTKFSEIKEIFTAKYVTYGVSPGRYEAAVSLYHGIFIIVTDKCTFPIALNTNGGIGTEYVELEPTYPSSLNSNEIGLVLKALLEVVEKKAKRNEAKEEYGDITSEFIQQLLDNNENSDDEDLDDEDDNGDDDNVDDDSAIHLLLCTSIDRHFLGSSVNLDDYLSLLPDIEKEVKELFNGVVFYEDVYFSEAPNGQRLYGEVFCSDAGAFNVIKGEIGKASIRTRSQFDSFVSNLFSEYEEIDLDNGDFEEQYYIKLNSIEELRALIVAKKLKG